MKKEFRKFELKNGRWYYDSPSFIFIRNISDDEILTLLEKEGITVSRKLESFNPRRYQYEFFVAYWKDWTVIVDNYWYALSYYKKGNFISDKFGEHYEVFACIFGDSDYSFSFKYQKSGKIIRHLDVSNPSYHKDDLKVEIDEGHPLKGEEQFLKIDEQYEKVINILYEQGIEFPEDIKNGNCYKYRIGQDEGRSMIW